MAAIHHAWPFPIGTPGVAWGLEERLLWKARVDNPSRSYHDDVLKKLEILKERFDVLQYGALEYIDARRFPLYAVRTLDWNSSKPAVLITGGVHGYETSGVQGALLFMQTRMEAYAKHFNIIVAPCVSPWAYEVIQRWNSNAVDPNRSFRVHSGCAEAEAVLSLIDSLGVGYKFLAHFDLHETTNTDATEFVPAKCARDGTDFTPSTIPDGFHLVADALNPQPEWHSAMIQAVRALTHIAPPDSEGKMGGERVTQDGVVMFPVRALSLCSGCTNATFATTTEVYPDSPRVTPELCNQAQVACIAGGLDYLLHHVVGAA